MLLWCGPLCSVSYSHECILYSFSGSRWQAYDSDESSLWSPLPPPRPNLCLCLPFFSVIQSCCCRCHQPIRYLVGDSIPLSSSLPKHHSCSPGTRCGCCCCRFAGRRRIEVVIGIIEPTRMPAKISIRMVQDISHKQNQGGKANLRRVLGYSH